MSDIVKEVDYDIWKEVYPTGRDHLIDFKGRRVAALEKIALAAVRELTDMDFDND